VRRLCWEHGIRAISLCPGFVATDMTAGVGSVERADMIAPEDLAAVGASLLALPVDMRYEDTL